MEKFYNYDIEVKYMNIYNDLIKKCNTEDNLEYNSEDVINICDDLFRHEILLSFGIDDIDDDKIPKILEQAYDTTNKYIDWNDIAKHINDARIKLVVNDDSKNLFYLLFSFDYFYLIHKILKECLVNEKINETTLEELKYKLSCESN